MEIRHGTHMEKQFNDKDIYQKSYGSAVSSETYPLLHPKTSRIYLTQPPPS